MATYRPIHITFWQDKFILKLTPEQKYFYLYLMTNSKTKQCGVYELPLSLICYETGYNIDTVTKLLNSFVELGKIKYDYSLEEIFICNWIKYNPINSRNISNCVIKELKEVKSEVFKNKFTEYLRKFNSGIGRERVNKEYKDVDFTVETLRGLQGAYKGLKAKTETKTETETKTKVVVVTNKLQQQVYKFFQEHKQTQQEADKFLAYNEARKWRISGVPVIDWKDIAKKWIENIKTEPGSEKKQAVYPDWELELVKELDTEKMLDEAYFKLYAKRFYEQSNYKNADKEVKQRIQLRFNNHLQYKIYLNKINT